MKALGHPRRHRRSLRCGPRLAALSGAISPAAAPFVRPALAILAALLCLLAPPAASAWTLRYHNPLRDPTTGGPFSCPDPSVTYAPAPSTGYILVCTSGLDRDAFPIYTSPDLVHWEPDGYVFPRGHEPWWSVTSTGRGSGGRFWAPELDRIDDRWVVYFAAEDNAARLRLQVPGGATVPTGRLVIGFGAATSLAGPWRTGVLHFAGQLPSAVGVPEPAFPAIDPGVVENPATSQIYMFWADEPNQIWAGQLGAGGTTLKPPVYRVLRTTEPFECDPRDHHCTVEAPEPFYAKGDVYMLYSGASTWDASYDVGVAEAPDPFGPFVKLDEPIIQSGGGFYSTGHTSEPILGPDGNTYVLYHARTKPGVQRQAATRYLMLGRLTWSGNWPQISAPGSS